MLGEWLKLGENFTYGAQNHNNGSFEIHMVLLYFYNITQLELNHTVLSQVARVNSRGGYFG